MKYIEATEGVQRAAHDAQEAKAYAEALKYATPAADVNSLKHAFLLSYQKEDALQNLILESYSGKARELTGKYLVDLQF